MIVNYFNDCDSCYPFNVNPAILLSRNRLVVRFENQPVGMKEVDCILLLSFTSKLVSPLWTAFRNQLECLGSSQNGKAIHERLCHTLAKFFLNLLRRITYFLKFFVLEADIHESLITVT